MKLQEILTSRFISGLALFLSRITPESIGYPLADRIARVIGSMRNSAPVRAVRANQWVLSQMRMNADELDAASNAVFRFTGYALYDYYHNLTHPQKVLKKVHFTPRIYEYIERARTGKEGTLFVLPHLGNFDMAGMALALQGLNFQVLSYPRPPGGYRLQNLIRRLTGIETTPMSLNAMRQAVERLKSGGTVLTGLDRPLGETNYRPLFFGRPANLPVAYVRLAMKAGVPIIVAAVTRGEDGCYLVDASEPVETQPYPDLKTEMEKNAEAVLRRAEEFIRRAPLQWVMYYPVWPDALNQAP